MDIFSVSYGGVDMSSLAEEIVITDIVESAAKTDVQLYPYGLRDGQYRAPVRRLSLSVDVKFSIRTENAIRRAEVRDLVAAWCVGGNPGKYLTVNTRPGKKLQCVVDTPIALDSSMDWSQDLTLTFTAYATPYWSDVANVQVAGMTEYDGEKYAVTMDVTVPGNGGDAVPMLVIVPYSTMSSLRIVCGDTMVEFTGLSVDAIVTMYSRDGVFYATYGPDSILTHRTAESSDELLLPCGKTSTVQIISDAEVQYGLTVGGLWL